MKKEFSLLILGLLYCIYGLYSLNLYSKPLINLDSAKVIKNCKLIMQEYIYELFKYSSIMIVNYYIIGFKCCFITQILSFLITILFFVTRYYSVVGLVHFLHKYTVSSLEKINIFSYIIIYSIKNSFLFIFVISLIAIIKDLNPENHIFNKKICICLSSILFSYKMVGNIFTKIGDIIADYECKIKQLKEEDKDNNVFTTIDNIGDIVGDSFGNFIDYTIIISILMCACKEKFNYISLLELISLTLGKIFSFVILIIISSFLLKSKTIFKIIDYLFISNILFWILFNSLIRSYNLVFNFNTFKEIYINELKSSSYMLFTSIIILLLSKFKIYELISKLVINFMNKITVFGMTLIFAISTTLALYFDIFNNILIDLINNNNFIFDSSSIRYFIVFAFYYIFKTDFGVLVDSGCGIYKRYITNNYKNISHKFNEVEEKLEEYDDFGNIFKLESKLFIFSILFLILKNINKSLYIRYVDVFSIIIISIVFIFLYILNKTISQTMSSKQICNQISKLSIISFTCITFSHYNLLLHNNKYIDDLFVLSIRLLFFSKIITIVGSLADIIKKQNAKNKNNTNIELNKEIIKNDLIGDFLKDVYGPTLFSISVYITILVYVFSN